MVQEFVPQPNTTKQGDEWRFITLFVVLAAAIVAGSWFVFVPTDSLARFVPTGAIAYIHENIRDENLIAPPPGTRPDEVAMFSYVTKDNHLSWATLITWAPYRRPSADELNALALQHAHTLGDTTYLLGDSNAIQKAEIARNHVQSLADNFNARKALDVVRAISPLQILVTPEKMPAEFFGPLATLTATIEPTVIGARRDHAVVHAFAMPIARAITEPATLGFGTPSGQTSFVSSTAIDTQGAPSFDPIPTFFGAIESSHRATGIPDTPDYLATKEQLRSLFRRAVEAKITLVPESAPVSIVRIADVRKDDVVRAILLYANAALPDIRDVVLPDRQHINEFVVSNRVVATSATIPVANDLNPLAIEEKQSGFHMIIASDANGVILSTDHKNMTETHLDASKCGTMPGIARIAISPQLLSHLSLLKIGEIGITTMIFTEAVDNTVFACGY